ncbi:MAG: hypothetical protein GQE15_33020 [Archangiaceae bacterium]|nr:hypothetical protein [Archangiaceae bacterium]
MTFKTIPARSPGIRLFSSGPLLVVEYVTAGTVESLDETSRHQHELISQHGKISILQMVTGAVGKVDDAVKKKAADMTKSLEGKVFGSAIVIPGTSLSTAMLRTVVTGINMLSKSSTPQKCYGTIEDALAWLKSLPGQPASFLTLSAKDVAALFPAQAKAA